MTGELTAQMLDIVQHSRALRALAACAALSLAAVGCGQPAHQLETQTSPGSQPHAAGTLPPDYVDPMRDVDFRNVIIDPNSCEDSALEWPNQLVNGTATKKNGVISATISVFDDKIAYGDLTGDGREEAAVPLVCDPGSEHLSYPVEVFTLSYGSPKPLGIVKAMTTAQDTDSQPTALHIENQKLIVEKKHYGKGDPTVTQDEWHWNGSQLIDQNGLTGDIPLTGSQPSTTPETTQATNRPTSTTETIPLNNQIDIDNFAGIKLGMSPDAIGGLGFVSEPGCGDVITFVGSHASIGAVFDKPPQQGGLTKILQVEDPFYRTPEGITVGSSEDAVLKAYGDNIQKVQVDDGPDAFQVDVYVPPADKMPPQDKGHKILFSIIGGQVKFISLTKGSNTPILC